MAAPIEALVPESLERARRQAPPCAFVVFGATGDLTHRKLLPAIYNLAANGSLPERFGAVGVARREMSDEAFREGLHEGVEKFSRSGLDDAIWDRFASGVNYCQGHFDDPELYRRLAMQLEDLDKKLELGGNRLFYMAVPPSEFESILKGLRKAGLIYAPGERSWSRVIIEKPFGHDLESARELNALVASVLDESQAFRIDHYLGKETVQNIMVFRFANSIFEPLWNRKYVSYVEITAAETVGIGSRGRFYEENGVLRDIVQNHLLEVLSLIAMEPPYAAGADEIRDEKVKVLKAMRVPWADTIAKDVVLGQYRGYRDEENVAPDSTTPTFAALRVFVDNWRWQGVPFYLRAGKKLKTRATEVSLFMQPIPLALFGRKDVCEHVEPNVLTLRIQPDEGIQLSFASKIPGHDLAVGAVRMNMSYLDTFGGEPPEAYERLLLDAMRGDATLFARRDAVEASWAWITPLLEHFKKEPPTGFPNYEPGSWGPESCHALMRRERRLWREL
jgi:glucose-6-phosphate 1-dehydrogenase